MKPTYKQRSREQRLEELKIKTKDYFWIFIACVGFLLAMGIAGKVDILPYL